MMFNIQVDIPPKPPLKWLGDYPKREEYNGFTFDEWHRLAGMVNDKIIELQEFVESEGKPTSAAKEMYPEIHRLMDKLLKCMSLAIKAGKSA